MESPHTLCERAANVPKLVAQLVIILNEVATLKMIPKVVLAKNCKGRNFVAEMWRQAMVMLTMLNGSH